MAATDNILAALGNSSGGSGPQRAITPPASNSLAGGGMGMGGGMKALLEKLKRQTAYQGFSPELMALLALLDGGLGGGGGGGNTNGGGTTVGCLHGDTLVRMADGSEKPAREIVVEDQLLGFDFDAMKQRPQSVFTVQSSRQPCAYVAFDNIPEIIASTSHPWMVLTEKGAEVVYTSDLRPGMKLLDVRGPDHPVSVAAIEEWEPEVVYWWNCTMNHNYYAGGVLHHNEGGGLGINGSSGVTTFGGSSFGKLGGGGGQAFTLGQQGSGGAGTN